MSSHATKPRKHKTVDLVPTRSSIANTFVYAIGLTLLCLFVYSSSLNGKFIFDDQQIVMQNSQMMNIHSLSEVVSFGAGWRQLLFFTYGLNYYWSGLDTFSYHVINVLLHAVNVLLVFGIVLAAVRDDPRRRFTAGAAAAVFAVHTMFSGAVSYIAGRSSLLCGTFYFAAILLFLKGLDSPRRGVRIAYFMATAAAG